MQRYVSLTEYEADHTHTVTGDFLYYLSGPDNISVRFETYVGPQLAAGRTFNVPIKPGDRIRLPPGERFQRLTVTNETDKLETRIELLAGFGEYIPGPGDPAAQAPTRLSYSGAEYFQNSSLQKLAVTLGNHIDNAVTAFVTKVTVQAWHRGTLADANVDNRDFIYITAGENGQVASSSDPDELVEGGSGDVVNNRGGAGIYHETVDMRFRGASSLAQCQMNVYELIGASTFTLNRALWLEGQDDTVQSMPSGGSRVWEPSAPLVLPPGFSLTAGCNGSAADSQRRQIGVAIDWYELPNGA